MSGNRVFRCMAFGLAIAQLVCWGFIAPAHRLLNHMPQYTSHQRVATSKFACNCHQPRCKTVATEGHRSESHVPHSPCPHEEDHCAICAGLLEQATDTTFVVVETKLEWLGTVVARSRTFGPVPTAQPCVARGPPIA